MLKNFKSDYGTRFGKADRLRAAIQFQAQSLKQSLQVYFIWEMFLLLTTNHQSLTVLMSQFPIGANARLLCFFWQDWS